MDSPNDSAAVKPSPGTSQSHQVTGEASIGPRANPDYDGHDRNRPGPEAGADGLPAVSPVRARTAAYYGRELSRRLRNYWRVRLVGYPDHGSLEDAAATIVATRAAQGFRPGGHFQGVWPRDLCFGAPGILARGYGDQLQAVADWLVSRLDDVFFTDVRADYGAAVPEEGVDTFPALVILLAACDRLGAHRHRIAELTAVHRERFFDPVSGLVAGEGSGWWDSASDPREGYNTAMLLAAVERLETAGIETVYGSPDRLRGAWLDALWTGEYVAERRGSAVLACDANVVPLYFGLVSEPRARSIADSLTVLETERGCKLRAKPFAVGEVHPFFALHRDYHYHVWPWNSLLYAIGLERYGLGERAEREVARVERTLGEYGTFLELYTVEGDPYVKRGYAAVGDFLVAAALWIQYRERTRGTTG